MVHSAADYEAAVEASQILFSNHAGETLRKIDEATLLAVMEGVPQFEVPRSAISEGVKLADLLTETAAVFPSKGEMRKMVQGGGVSINKEKISDPYAPVSADMLLNDKYILVQRGKKNYFPAPRGRLIGRQPEKTPLEWCCTVTSKRHSRLSLSAKS